MLREYLSIWKDIFLSPKIAIPRECKRKNAGILEGAKHLFLSVSLYFAIVLILLIALGALFMLFAASIFAALKLPESGMLGLSAIGAFGLVVLLLYAILLFLFMQAIMFFFSFLNNAIYYLVANALGGKGDFSRQFYAMSAQSSGEYFIANAGSLLFLPFMFIPCLSIFFLLLYLLAALAFFLYSAYLKIKILAQVHSLEISKAFVCWAVPAAIAVIALVLLFALYWAAIMASIAASASAPFPAPTTPY